MLPLDVDEIGRPRALIVCCMANGGLGVATADIASQLARLGWDVTALINADAILFDPPVTEDRRLPPMLSEIEHKASLMVPERTRVFIRDRLGVDRSLVMLLRQGRTYVRTMSRSLALMERVIDQMKPDVVLLACDSLMPPGATALVLATHPGTVILTMLGLARELAAHGWPATRLLARLRSGGTLHPYLFRRVAQNALQTVVFASRAWMQHGVVAGVPAEATRVIYHGVPIGPVPPRPRFRQHLLWVGRLSPEKGLHVFLHAFPALRQAHPDVRLTVVGDWGPGWYRREIDRLLDNLKLRDVVVILPGVPRHEVPAYYAKHDILLFYSPNAEPVALVAKEAFAAGIPIVCSRPTVDSPLIQDEITCLTYDPDRIDSVVAVVSRMLRDEGLRKALAQNAREVAASTFSHEAMGHQFDDLLRGLLRR